MPSPFSFLILKTVFKALFRGLALCQIFFWYRRIKVKDIDLLRERQAIYKFN